MQEERTFRNWVKTHKTEIIIGCVTVASIVAIVLLVGKKDVLEELRVTKFTHAARNSHKMACSSRTISPVASAIAGDSFVDNLTPLKAIDVSKHLRILSEGSQPSAAKLATAAENGFSLQSGQTWVESYIKQCV